MKLYSKKRKRKQAQSMLEYTALIGLIVIVLLAMSTGIRRGTQGMVKLVSDFIGIQTNAEQTFDDRGYLVGSNVAAQIVQDETRTERLGVFNYIPDDRIFTQSQTSLNLGFTERRN